MTTVENRSPEAIWVPDSDRRVRARITGFGREAAARYDVDVDDYATLHQWSVDRPEEFWELVWDFCGIVAERRFDRVVQGGPMRGVRWFEGARLNYVDQVLRHRDRPGAAVVSIAEDGARRELGWVELTRQVAAFADRLRSLGVRPGERVVGYLTNAEEAIVAFLGTAAVGAVWAGCAPDYGASAAADRLAQLSPRVLVATTAYRFAGRVHDRSEVVADLATRLGVATVVEVRREGVTLDPETVPCPVLSWRDVTSCHVGEPVVDPLPADHPLWVLFSSGTTGVPKGIVHSHAGVVTTHLALLTLQHDLSEQDTLFWYTTTNWMLWNIVVGALLVGATTIAYEGSPAHPGADRLWQIIERERVTMFGTSPGHLQHCRTAQVRPGASHDLTLLTQIAVTGAPAPAAAYTWVRDEVSARVPLISVSGGTDIVSCFIGGAPTLPVYPGEIPGPVLGAAVAAFDERGEPVQDSVGELVVTAPMPSMPLRFWNDPDGAKLHAAYFDTYPGVWRHGDWVTHTSRGTFVVHGRSDSTLNRNGVRFGSADIYQIVETMPEVAEALVVGVERPDGSYRMPLFLVAAPDHDLDDDVLALVRTRLRVDGSPRHVPDEIIVVSALPHTKTGKKLEVPLKRILQGAAASDVVSDAAVDNPALVQQYVRLAETWSAQESAQRSAHESAHGTAPA